jgi:DNA repair protein RadA/Sms
MILAVLERRGGVVLAPHDVFAATVGGVKLQEPAVDLAVALAIASAATDRLLLPGLVAMGEVGLSGELRPIAGVERRLAEAHRLGFTKAIIPSGVLPQVPTGLQVLQASDISTAIRAASSA